MVGKKQACFATRSFCRDTTNGALSCCGARHLPASTALLGICRPQPLAQVASSAVRQRSHRSPVAFIYLSPFTIHLRCYLKPTSLRGAQRRGNPQPRRQRRRNALHCKKTDSHASVPLARNDVACRYTPTIIFIFAFMEAFVFFLAAPLLIACFCASKDLIIS